MLEMRITERHEGPLFIAHGRYAKEQMDKAADEIEEKIAKRGEHFIHQYMNVFREPTGYYRSHVYAERSGAGWELSDHGVIYGPWLEGIGSRNAPVTRFKGYQLWRRLNQTMNREARQIADRVIDKYVRRLNG